MRGFGRRVLQSTAPLAIRPPVHGGQHRSLIGDPKKQAWVASEANNEVVFTFQHIDDTVSRVSLCSHQRGMERELHICI